MVGILIVNMYVPILILALLKSELLCMLISKVGRERSNLVFIGLAYLSLGHEINLGRTILWDRNIDSDLHCLLTLGPFFKALIASTILNPGKKAAVSLMNV